MTRHVVMFSGGIGSWATAKRVAATVDTSSLTLLFADTKVEDVDLYRFISAAARNVGADLITVADGRTPFEVFRDDRFLGNSRLANCSKFLKQKPCRDWLDAHRDPADTMVYVGIDWSEIHRMPAITTGWAPYEVRAPMTEAPYRDKAALLEWMRSERLTPPRAYAEGFTHNNCLTTGCVRGGQAYWQQILRQRPDAYAVSEREEQSLREHLDADVSILKDRRGGPAVPLTLREFREHLEARPALFDADEWGDCGCFTEEAA